MTTERIAKVIARSGVCSRRQAEQLIEEGRVKLFDQLVTTPATKVTDQDEISIDNQPISKKQTTRLWLYHKPKGQITSHYDPQGRPTVFDNLPDSLPRVISIGRLDFNTEGLLLLTNDGELARQMELPANNYRRMYRVRVFGQLNMPRLNSLSQGVTIEGTRYKPIELEITSQKANNSWLTVIITEGKNREIRRIFEHLGLQVTRLIRVAYGEYELGELPVGQIKEVMVKI